MSEPKPSKPSGKRYAKSSPTPPEHPPLTEEEKAAWIADAIQEVELNRQQAPSHAPQTPDDLANRRLA